MLLSLRERINKTKGNTKLKAITLNLAVKDIKETIKYYQENFDFEVQMLVYESKTIFDI